MERQDDGLIIRTLRSEDLERLVRMDQAYTGRNRRTWYEGKLKRALAETDVRISLGAERDGLLVGAFLGTLHYGEFGQPEPLAILDTLLVDPSAAHQGVGRALLDQLVKNLAAFGIERVRTEVAWNEEILIRFLGKAGFVPVPRLVLELDVAAAAGKPDDEA